MDLLAAMRVFCDVAEQGRLTLSAASRGVNPSVLSRQISALESEVGGTQPALDRRRHQHEGRDGSGRLAQG